MVKISIDLDWETYLKAKKSGKDHREIFCDGLGEEYETRKVGRPRAFDVEEYERKARQIHLDKIKKYNLDHAEEYKQARAELGLDAAKGTTTAALGLTKKKRV